jgi:hypothetical protein
MVERESPGVERLSQQTLVLDAISGIADDRPLFCGKVDTNLMCPAGD